MYYQSNINKYPSFQGDCLPATKIETGIDFSASRKKFQSVDLTDEKQSNTATEPANTAAVGESKKAYSTGTETPKLKSVGPGGRKGRFQRDKRMLRQKRRSTGVVSAADMEATKEEQEKVDDVLFTVNNNT